VRVGALGLLLVLGCAGRGEVARAALIRYKVCQATAAASASSAFARGEALFRRAVEDFEAERDAEAARGFLAAAAAFQAALVEDPRLGAARTNMRKAYADAALVWLTASRDAKARAALKRARADDPTMQAHWQRAIDELPDPPSCAFKLEPGPVTPESSGPTTAPVSAPVVEPPVVEPPVVEQSVVEPSVAAPSVAAPEPVVHEPCGKVERGEARRKHEFIGQAVAELDDSGGEILCGRDPIWQLRFGTLCGDMASFHRVVTVEVRAGRVTRVWEAKKYNDGFCASEF